MKPILVIQCENVALAYNVLQIGDVADFGTQNYL
jgi:hypothetical protein